MAQLVKTFVEHTEPVASIAVSNDGRRLLSGSGRGRDGVILWSVDAGSPIHRFPIDEDDAVRAVAFSPDGGYVAAATHHNTVILWNTETRDRIGSVASADPSGGIGVAFPGDGSFLLAAHGRRYTRFGLQVEPLQEYDNLQSGRIDSPSLSRQGRFVASIHDPDSGINLVVYDLLSDRSSLRLGGNPGALYNAVAISPDGGSLLTGDVRGKLKLLDATTGSVVRSFDAPGHARIVTSVAFSPSGLLAISGSEDNTAKVWDVATGRPTVSLDHGGGFVRCVAVSRDSRFAFSGGNDKTVKLWDLSTDRPTRALASAPDHPIPTPDGG